jgi:8-oxo-dGTP pyrophosphatase MutT (NUDIX family)
MSAGKENIDIYDRYGRKTGKTKDRSLGLADDEYFLGAHAWIVNSKNEFLIQKRAAAKEIMPNMWCIHGGAVRVGETSIDTCVREIYEELGIKVDTAKAELVSEKVEPDVWRCWLDVYVIRQEAD